MEMVVKVAEIVKAEVDTVRPKKATQHVESVENKPVKGSEELVKDQVDLSQPAKAKAEQPIEIKSEVMGHGNQYEYRVDSANDLIIRVKSGDTLEEVKEIPSREAQAAKRAYHSVVDHLIDKTA